MRFKAFASLLVVLLCLLLPAAQAEVCNVTTLNSQEDLKMGKIIDVDAVDTTLLIAVKYNDAMQVWIWDVYDGFQYGYEIKSTYILSKASYALSADHILLIVLGKYMPTLANRRNR